MKILPISAQFAGKPVTEDYIISKLGTIAGVAYQAETDFETARKRLIHCMKHGHDSVLEHETISLLITTDIGTAKALCRHRHIAITQESTIYCNYSNKKYDGELQVIEPVNDELEQTLLNIENAYMSSRAPAKDKRDILPHITKTTIAITGNIRSWRYIIGLRTDPKDSSRMHTTVEAIKKLLATHYPFFFENVPELWK